MTTAIAIAPLGDSSVSITFGEGMSELLSTLVVEHACRIGMTDITGVTDVVPSYATLGVYYDPRAIAFNDLRERLNAILADPIDSTVTASDSVLHRIRVQYDGEDLNEVAGRLALTPEDVIRIHSEHEYRVYVIGFVPGFAYLGTLDERLALPRRDSPRKRVPAGSVAIAERQTGIYPSVTPGGWHLIGKTTEKLFDPASERPSLLKVGDRVKFEP